MTSAYQIGTGSVRVEVSMAGGERLVGEMFLRPAAGGARYESVASRLNEPAPFFPLR